MLLRIRIRMDIAVVVIAVLPDKLHGVGHRHLVNLLEGYDRINLVIHLSKPMLDYLLDVLPHVVFPHSSVVAEGAEERLDRGVHLDVFVVGHGHAEDLERNII